MSSAPVEENTVTESQETVAVDIKQEIVTTELQSATENPEKANLTDAIQTEDPVLIEKMETEGGKEEQETHMEVAEQKDTIECPPTGLNEKNKEKETPGSSIVERETAVDSKTVDDQNDVVPMQETSIEKSETTQSSAAIEVTTCLESASDDKVDTNSAEPESRVEDMAEVKIKPNSSEMESGDAALNPEIQLDSKDPEPETNLPSPSAENTTGSESVDKTTIVEIKDDANVSPTEEKMSYRKFTNPYDSESSVSSDESSIQLSSDSEDEEHQKKMAKKAATDQEQQGNKSTKKSKGQKNKELFEVDMRTKGELTLDDLPQLDELKIDVDPKVVLMEVGAVQNILGPIAIIQANKMVPALDQDTIMFSEDRTPLGQVFETFGPVQAPLYVVRFNSPEDIEQRGLLVGNKIFYAPEMKEYTRFVFVEQLKQIRGSDASWEHNNEPPEKYLDFSDDEEERRARQRARGHDVEEGEEDTDKKRRKRKPHSHNKTSTEGHKESRSHQSRLTQWPPKDPGHGWRASVDVGPRPQWPPAPPPGGVGYREPSHPPSSFWGNRPHTGTPARNRTPPGPPPRASPSPAPPAWGGPPGIPGPAPPAWGGPPGPGGPPPQVWHHQNTSGFNEVRPRGPPPPPANPAHRAPMDMRYVQNTHGPEDCGPGPIGQWGQPNQHQPPPPPASQPRPSWHAPRPPQYEGPPPYPQGQNFRPEFRGSSNFSQGQHPRPEFGGAPNFYQGPPTRPPFGGGPGFGHGPPPVRQPVQFGGMPNFPQGPPGWN